MKLLLSVVSLSLFVSCTFAQTPQHTYLKSALDFQYSVSPLRQQTCFLALNDSNRFTWSRLPGDRPGLKLSQMNEEQKLFFHRMLRAFFPSTGYLKITAIMFNEDIQKKNEPELGKNEYWLLFFGELGEDSEWGWKLEGHHLSINIMLKGNELLAFTPMILATNPAVTNGDGERDGMVLLYEEEELGRKLLHSLSANQLEKAYSEGPKPNHPLGEDFQNLTDMPQEGILYSALTDAQKQIFHQLIDEYRATFWIDAVPTTAEILTDKTRFFYVEGKEANQPHYYRIDNGTDVIEYENYSNHIHLLWRRLDDHGLGK